MRFVYQPYVQNLDEMDFANRRTQLANWISNIFSPPVFGFAGISILALNFRSVQEWYWMFFYFGVALGFPILYLAFQVRQGKISDFHMRIRQQRVRPMLFMIACSFAAWLVLYLGSSIRLLSNLALAGCILLVFLLVITLWWKISGHSTAVSAFSIFLISNFGPIASPILLLIPVVMWSRISLRYHSPGQTLAGLITGGVFMLSLLYTIS